MLNNELSMAFKVKGARNMMFVTWIFKFIVVAAKCVSGIVFVFENKLLGPIISGTVDM